MSRRRRDAALAPLALLAGLGAAGCDDGLVHLFGAHRWDPDRGCLESAAAVDVIDGADPGQCAELRCWQSPAAETYVTTTACDAPPDYREGTHDPADSPCGLALAAYAGADHGICPASP